MSRLARRVSVRDRVRRPGLAAHTPGKRAPAGTVRGGGSTVHIRRRDWPRPSPSRLVRDTLLPLARLGRRQARVAPGPFKRTGDRGAKDGAGEQKPRRRTGGSGAGVSHALVPRPQVARTPQPSRVRCVPSYWGIVVTHATGLGPLSP